MNLGCIDSLLGSSFESFVPLNFVSGELHTLSNLHFLLRNAIVKYIYFLRDPVLISWCIHRVCSLGICGSNTKLDFSGLGRTRGRGVVWAERLPMWFTCKCIVF